MAMTLRRMMLRSFMGVMPMGFLMSDFYGVEGSVRGVGDREQAQEQIRQGYRDNPFHLPPFTASSAD